MSLRFTHIPHKGFSACVSPAPIFQVSLTTGCVTVGYEVPGYFETWTTCVHGEPEELTCRCNPYGPDYCPCSVCYELNCNYEN